MQTPDQSTVAPADRAGTLLFLDAERKAHAAAAASRCVAYVERANQLRTLDEFARPEPNEAGANVLVVHGASGSGKSALLAYWSARRSPNAERGFLVSHFIGATASSTDHVELIRRIILEVRERFDLREELPSGRMNTEEALPKWLGFVQSEDLFLIVDGLDQLSPRSRDLVWLPIYIQPRVHLLLSSNDAAQIAVLRERGARELEIQPLTRSDRLAIARRHISVRGSRLSRADVRRVTAAPASANPLFLRTSLEEVRAHPDKGDGRELVEYYLAASGLEDLYGRMLTRVEDEHGAPLVGDVLALIMASRRGLTREELGQMTGNQAGVGALAKRLEFFLIDRMGCLSLLHQELRNAVIARYAPDAVLTGSLHRRLADFFFEIPSNDRSVDELAWQLSQCADRPRLAQFLSNLDVFHALYSRDEGLELQGYLLELGSQFDFGLVYVGAFDELIERETDMRLVAAIGTELGIFLHRSGRVESAISVLEQLVSALAQCAELSLERSRALMRLASANESLGELPRADALLHDARELLDASAGGSPADRLALRSAQVDLLYERGSFVEAESIVRESLAIATESYGSGDPMTAEVLADLGAVLLQQGRLADAEDVLRSAVSVAERSHGPDHPATAQALNNLASVVTERDQEQALKLFLRVADANKKTLGPLSGAYAAARVNTGLLRKNRGDFAEAERDYREALDILVSSHQGQSLAAASILFNLGALYEAMERIDEARSALSDSYRLREHLLGPGNARTLAVLTRIMQLEWNRGDFERAEELCRLKIARLREIFGDDHQSLAVPRNELSALLRRDKFTEEHLRMSNAK